MKIQTRGQHKNGTISLPIVGEVEIIDGIVEVSEEVGNIMLERGGDNWDLVDSKTGKAVMTKPKEKVGKKKTVKEEDENKDEDADIEEQLAQIPDEELAAFAEEAGIKNWQKLKDKPETLRKYIINTLKK